jgi:tRNA dimethylallyltransferase
MTRERLYDRINDRSRHMIEVGLIDETSALIERGYSPELRSMNSLGYRHAAGFLNKEYNLEVMMSRLKQDTRRYAKRQLTWFRADHEMIWADPENPGFIKSKIQGFLD